MISFDEAYRIVMDSVVHMEAAHTGLRESVGRVVAADIVSDVDVPPHDKSMVDGYACRQADLGTELECIETVPAGYVPEHVLEAAQCAKVMTGAPVPQGADTVFMVEHSEAAGNGRVRFTGDETNANIVARGTDIRRGDVVLSPGHRIGAQDVPTLATAGVVSVPVSKRPRVAIIATGDELVEPSTAPGPAQIRNSNAFQLEAQVRAAGGTPHYTGIARDNEESLQKTFDAIPKSSSVVLVSGGVSMGEFDLVPFALKAHGFKPLFEKIKIQPGKPTVFARSSNRALFGLPGNPVATFVIFELLVKPYLLRTMGHNYEPVCVPAVLKDTFVRRSGGRKAWVPVRFDSNGDVTRIEYHGSAHIHAYRDAQGMIAFPESVTELAAGETVTVRLLNR